MYWLDETFEVSSNIDTLSIFVPEALENEGEEEEKKKKKEEEEEEEKEKEEKKKILLSIDMSVPVDQSLWSNMPADLNLQ